MNNFSLYKQQPSFEFSFSEGINAIIGVNGIGKTTFVEMILYCLLGFKKEYRLKKYKRKTTLEVVKENTNYFSSRFNNTYPDNHQASVTITFLVGENVVEIRRSLYEDKILFLRINQTNFEEINEEIYEASLLELTGFLNFKSLQTIVRNFLFFDEMRINVAWEEDNQDEILRILFFNEELFNQFNTLEQTIIELDTRAKHLSEDRRIFRQKLDELLSERNELLQTKDNVEKPDPILLSEKKNNLELEKIDLLTNLEQLSDEFKIKERELNKLVGDKNRTAQQLEQIETEVNQLEVKLYSSVYDNLPDFYLSVERRMLNDGTCLVCNNHDKRLIKHAMEYSERGQCLICSSPLKEEVELDTDIIERVNKLSEIKDQLNVVLSNQSQQLEAVNKAILRINETVEKKREKFDEIGIQLIQIESLLSEIAGKQENDTFTEIVRGREKKILELTNTIKETLEQKK